MSKQTQAKLPDGRDAFNIIAERLDGLKRPVDSLCAIADKFAAEHAFRMFALHVHAAIAAYELYLLADVAALDAKLQNAVAQVDDAPRIALPTSH